jgi:mRNA interferase MazF
MPTFDPFDVVAVPFPYVEREVRKRRPTVVVSRPKLAVDHGLVWVVMVTTAANEPAAHDVPVSDLVAAGLPKPSVVRVCKIATIEATRCERIGRLSPDAAKAVAACLRDAVA